MMSRLREPGCELLTLLVIVALVTPRVATTYLTDEEYYSMPQLYHLDDYRACLARPAAVYCLGVFELQPRGNSQVFELIKQHSANEDHFNRTRLYRGLCLSTRCEHKDNAFLPEERFQDCVNDWSVKHYGLEARLNSLDYCRSKDETVVEPIGNLGVAFISLLGVLLLFNFAGTVYDLMFKPEKNANPYLMCWSAADNLRRLWADHADGEPRLAALKPLQGMKTLTLMLIMMAHTSFAYYMTYIQNPEFLERAKQYPLTFYFYNGTVIVQTFVTVAGFLLAYNLLLHAETQKKPLSLAMLPQAIFLRLARIGPVNLLTVWWAMTWWPHVGDGPVWAPLIQGEASRCRDKWWAQLLFVNNFVRPHDRCLIQTWFLAMDLQLYVVAAALTLLLVRCPRRALPPLAALFLLSIVSNFIIAQKWDLKTMLFLMHPERMRVQFAGEASFAWFYIAPWGSLPASLLGVLLAFLYYWMQQSGFDPKNHVWAVISYRLSVPLMFLWVGGGWYFQAASTPLQMAVYSALDRPVFVLLGSVVTIGSLYKMDEIWWRFLSLHAWTVLGRMSLTTLMVHWCFTLSYLALRPLPVYASVLEIWGTWVLVMFMTYLVSLPVYLLVETPMYRFLRVLVR